MWFCEALGEKTSPLELRHAIFFMPISNMLKCQMNVHSEVGKTGCHYFFSRCLLLRGDQRGEWKTEVGIWKSLLPVCSSHPLAYRFWRELVKHSANLKLVLFADSHTSSLLSKQFWKLYTDENPWKLFNKEIAFINENTVFNVQNSCFQNQHHCAYKDRSTSQVTQFQRPKYASIWLYL